MTRSTTQVPVCLPLNPLAGQWITTGRMLDGSGGEFDGVDSYEWVAGGHFLLHRWDVEMPDGRNEGIEVIGYDGSAGKFAVRSFDNQGGESSMSLAVVHESITIVGDNMRFEGQITGNGSMVQGVWQLNAGEQQGWAAWMQVRLVRSGGTD